MKKLLLIFIMIPFLTVSQIVKSKDGVEIGDRKDFIRTCTVSGLKTAQELNIGNVTVGWREYCGCVVDKLIPNITSRELMDAYLENDIMSLFFKEDNLEFLMSCVEGFASDNETALSNLELKIDNDPKIAKIQRDLSLKECIKGFYENSSDEYEDLISEDQIIDYCNCAVDKMFEGGYTFGDMLQVENENSDSYNEIVMPCINEILESKSILNNVNTKLRVTGGGISSRIPLVNYFGNGYKLKINIDGVESYFLLDTGASDILINRDIERELLLNGALSRKDYIGKTEYIMANNQSVEAQIIRVDKIKIGDYSVSDVEIAIIDYCALLCGISFLDVFEKWEIDKNSKTLILYK